MRFEQTRIEIVTFARQMLADKLVTLTAGNLSLRVPGEDLIAITPTSYPYDVMRPEDVPIITLDGIVVDGDLGPSSEEPMHTLIMREAPNVNAIVHTHSPYALAFAVAHKPLPFVSVEGLAARAMSVLVAPYATPGTEELGRRAIETLSQQLGSQAVLLANHGLLALGKTLADAYSIASRIETEARIYQLALAIGTPVHLTEDQVVSMYERYEKPKS